MAREREIDGTTYREVVDKARSRQELIERLYAFTMNAQPRLGPRCSRDALSETTAEMIVHLLEISSLATSSTETENFEHTIAALRQVRAPSPGARIHREAGWRARIKQRLLRELGAMREAPRELDGVDPMCLAAPVEESAVDALCVGDFSEPVLEEIHAHLERSWSKVLDEVRDALRAASRTTTWQRRAAILDVLAGLAAEQTEYGVVSDTLETVLDQVAPEPVIERVKEAVRAGGILGSTKVSITVWRKDVAMVRAFFRERLAWMRETERELRLTGLAAWTGKVVRRDLRANAERLRGTRGGA